MNVEREFLVESLYTESEYRLCIVQDVDMYRICNMTTYDMYPSSFKTYDDAVSKIYQCQSLNDIRIIDIIEVWEDK